MKDLNDVKNQEPRTTSEDSAFIFRIEKNIEETEIYKSKREFNGYMKQFPKKKRKIKRAKNIFLQKKYDSFNDNSQSKFTIDKHKQIADKFLSDDYQNNFRMDKSEQIKSRFINYDCKTKFIIDKPEQLQHKLVTDQTQRNLKIDKLEKKYRNNRNKESRV